MCCCLPPAVPWQYLSELEDSAEDAIDIGEEADEEEEEEEEEEEGEEEKGDQEDVDEEEEDDVIEDDGDESVYIVDEDSEKEGR